MTGSGTGDAVFILRRLTEKYWSKGKQQFYEYVVFKKAIDREPHNMTGYTFAKRSVTECSLQNMLYIGFKTAVSVDSELFDFYFAQVDLFSPNPDKQKKLSLSFTFTLLCGASKGFTKPLKVLIMNFGALV